MPIRPAHETAPHVFVTQLWGPPLVVFGRVHLEFTFLPPEADPAEFFAVSLQGSPIVAFVVD